jgi:hypothetical protein
LLDRQSITWATPPAFSVLVISEIGSHFMPVLASTMILLFVLPSLPGMTGTQHSSQMLDVVS